MDKLYDHKHIQKAIREMSDLDLCTTISNFKILRASVDTDYTALWNRIDTHLLMLHNEMFRRYSKTVGYMEQQTHLQE